ncbi:hypothetical protein P7C73_g6757, partial [Tremellales sp. Uapishka_1]
MAQSCFLSTPTFASFPPHSPDPTPLRLIAFSVAESALQPDPNSPSFGAITAKLPAPIDVLAEPRWQDEDWNAWPKAQKSKRGTPLWDVVERAKERRERENSSESSSATSPPVSPSAYNFILPANSSLAKSIAAASTASYRINAPSLTLSPTKGHLYTRSAEPSPTKSTFSTLDQSLPPPEFVPRLSASDFKKPKKPTHSRTKSDIPTPAVPAPSQLLRSQITKARLPSLAQIQAKVAGGHRRGASVGSVPLPREAEPKIRSKSDEVESTRDPKEILSEIFNRRSPLTTPSRLPSFLRTASARPRTSSPRPISIASTDDSEAPALKITPPTLEPRSPVRPTIATHAGFPWSASSSTCISPTDSLSVSTPPSKYCARAASPVSPSGSFTSNSTSSPTLSVPRITCTPAPQVIVKDGIEVDSDEESEEDVIILHAGDEADEEEREKEKEERERRGDAMRKRLLLRGRASGL